MLKDSKPQHEQRVKSYFSEKASGYDLVDKQAYWRLSDSLLWKMLSELITNSVTKDFNFLDAGGGTGRWSERILRAYPNSNGCTFDLSEDMLAVAKSKRDSDPVQLGERWTLANGDLHNLDVEQQFDLIICFHNVLGFVWDPQKVLENLSKALKPGGKLALVVPNKFHGVYFSLTQHNLQVASRIALEDVGVFTKEMPSMDFFDPGYFEKTLSPLGLNDISVAGFPLFIYPGHSETQINGQTKTLADLLENEANFSAIYEIETKYIGDTRAAWRGNNLFVTGTRPY